jgi:hypothetical protein
MLAVRRPDLPAPPGAAALRRLAEAVTTQTVGVREGEGVDARDAVPLPPSPGRPVAARPEGRVAVRDVAQERAGRLPAEQGPIGGAPRASRRK